VLGVLSFALSVVVEEGGIVDLASGPAWVSMSGVSRGGRKANHKRSAATDLLPRSVEVQLHHPGHAGDGLAAP